MGVITNHYIPKSHFTRDNRPIEVDLAPGWLSSTRGGEISLSREAAPDCWEAPPPRPAPPGRPLFTVPLPPTWGFLFPAAAQHIGSLHLRYPLLLWGHGRRRGTSGAHNILSTFMVDWEWGGKKKKIQSNRKPPTHILAMEERIPLIAGPRKIW